MTTEVRFLQELTRDVEQPKQLYANQAYKSDARRLLWKLFTG